MGGRSHLNRVHGPGYGNVTQRNWCCRPRRQSRSLHLPGFVHRNVPGCLRVHPAHPILHARRFGVRASGLNPRPPRRVLRRLRAAWHLPAVRGMYRRCLLGVLRSDDGRTRSRAASAALDRDSRRGGSGSPRTQPARIGSHRAHAARHRLPGHRRHGGAVDRHPIPRRLRRRPRLNRHRLVGVHTGWRPD